MTQVLTLAIANKNIKCQIFVVLLRFENNFEKFFLGPFRALCNVQKCTAH